LITLRRSALAGQITKVVELRRRAGPCPHGHASSETVLASIPRRVIGTQRDEIADDSPALDRSCDSGAGERGNDRAGNSQYPCEGTAMKSGSWIRANSLKRRKLACRRAIGGSANRIRGAGTGVGYGAKQACAHQNPPVPFPLAIDSQSQSAPWLPIRIAPCLRQAGR